MLDQKLIDDVVEAIENSSPRCGNFKLITIDGPAGSGKTTLARQLAKEFERTSLIHMDELYAGWAMALDPVLFERIHAWIVTPLRNGLPPRHLLYDWAQMRFAAWKEIELAPIIIIEGVGSGNTVLREFVSQAIWISADDELLLDRVLQRDGEAIRQEMLTWKSQEKDYFESHQVEKFAQLHLRGQ